MGSQRLGYLAAATVLFVLLVIIAIGMNGGVVRTHGGDALVVGWLYFLLRAVFLPSPRVTLGIVLTLAFLIELGQGIALIERLGLGEVAAAELAFGRHFDPLDLVAYSLGGAGAYVADRRFLGRL
ncbi:MAG: DUF2809 domain-containing protein [Pseudomonadota bacterium]